MMIKFFFPEKQMVIIEIENKNTELKDEMLTLKTHFSFITNL